MPSPVAKITAIAAKEIQAPWVNLVTSTMHNTMPVISAPKALMAWARRIRRRFAGSRSVASNRCQCRIMPDCDSTNDTNGPRQATALTSPGTPVRVIALGDSLIMLADEFPEMGIRGPKAIGGSPVTISVYVEDVDAIFARALEAGATPVRDVEDQFYGDRAGQFEDPFGHRWSISTHIEDVPPDEMAKRAAGAMSG